MDYNRQIATVKRLIAKYGGLVKWQQNVVTPDENAPWKVSAEEESPVEHDVYIAFIPVNRVGYELFRFMKNSEVETGTTKALMGAVDFEPSAKDTVLSNGETLRIRNVDPIKPDGKTVILYQIEFDV